MEAEIVDTYPLMKNLLARPLICCAHSSLESSFFHFGIIDYFLEKFKNME